MTFQDLDRAGYQSEMPEIPPNLRRPPTNGHGPFKSRTTVEAEKQAMIRKIAAEEESRENLPTDPAH
jgi:hypothetical protein